MSPFKLLPALVLVVSATSLAADSLPKRKAGLWSLEMKNEQMPPIKSQQCIDATTDEAMQRRALQGGPSGKQDCKASAPKKIAGGFEVETDCSNAEGKIHSVAHMTGDFNTDYSVESTMRFDPPRHGLSSAKMTVTAKYEGPCPSDLKPGEIRLGAMGAMKIDPSKPTAGIDVEKIKNMSPEERKKWVEEMQQRARSGH